MNTSLYKYDCGELSGIIALNDQQVKEIKKTNLMNLQLLMALD